MRFRRPHDSGKQLIKSEPMDNSGWNMYVFRDGRKTVEGTCIRERLVRAVEKFARGPSEDACIGALIAAGELECALADAGAESAESASATTDLLGDAFVRGARINLFKVSQATSNEIPKSVSLSVAEGFAYYALHPQKYVDTVRALEAWPTVRVIGLRSIGTTLSALAGAAFREKGASVERITVRPCGHPYERQMALTERQKEWLLDAKDSLVVIVDEGPGISGSSFLSVAESVEQAGVSPERILLLGSREPDVAKLLAPRAAMRWPRFRFVAVAAQPVLPEDAEIDVSGGCWRKWVLRNFDEQPASWTQLESAKYLSKDFRRLFKFHGFGYFGETIARRARELSKSGFGPRFERLVRGFGVYEFVAGRVLQADELTPAILLRMAEYCAFRKRAFPTDERPQELEEMANWNWECEFGEALRPAIRLRTEHLVITDARMLPHEWLIAEDGRILKLDGVSHGDNHFFPGPCDIAWDLAGAIIEWSMDERTAAEFLEKYLDLSGDDARERLPEYLLAYAILRMAWSKMAAQASAGAFDEALLKRDYERYRARALELAEKWKAELHSASPTAIDETGLQSAA